MKGLKRYRLYVILLLIIFFAYGLRGLLDISTRQHFISLFPLALLISIALILLFTENRISINFIVVFLLIGVSGFLIELAGIRTKIIFGDYSYGDTLGYKILDTPVIIGLNWAMLVYATSSVTEKMKLPLVALIIGGSALMVLYDVLLEIIAPIMGMWTWSEGTAPLRNFIAWFTISIIFHSLVRYLRIETRSTLALPILIIHMFFFISLIIFL